MDDLISRQAAVELAMKYCPDDDGSVQCDGDIRELLDELENLPLVQSHLQPTCNQLATDCISRQEALKEVEEWRKSFLELCHNESASDVKFIRGGIEQLPSAQFKRINNGTREITESDKISYSVICDKFPSPHIYFNTYGEAEHWAGFNQPNYRPYYIIERSEHFEIVGEVR